MDGQRATMVQIPPVASHASVFVSPLALREQAFGLEVNILPLIYVIHNRA